MSFVIQFTENKFKFPSYIYSIKIINFIDKKCPLDYNYLKWNKLKIFWVYKFIQNFINIYKMIYAYKSFLQYIKININYLINIKLYN